MKVATTMILSFGLCGLSVPLRAQVLPGASAPPRAAAPARSSNSAWDGVYTLAQATRGAVVAARCAVCHGRNLEGQVAPTLVGPVFAERWNGWTLGDMFERIVAEMRSLSREPDADNKNTSASDRESLAQQSADVLAHLLRVNQFPAGDTELAVKIELLRQIRFQAIKP